MMNILRKQLLSNFALAMLLLLPMESMAEHPVEPDTAIDKWVRAFQPSALSPKEQRAELSWFREAAKPLRGMTIRSAAETIDTHYWERDVLAKAFEEITGIHVEHDIIHEGDLVRDITEQMMTGRVLYHVYVNDSDMIGTHLRLNRVVDFGRYMRGEGKPYTNPRLDLDDFLNLEFGQDYDGNQLQIPDEQFPSLYWFRYDWFSDPDTQKAFKAKYGYALGVPVNWEAYEDIAEFFTGRQMKNPDGSVVKAYGHLDYGKPSPDLGWRFTDAWLSIAGAGDKGLPNGTPVDEWGIRVEDRIPVGSMVERGGDLDGPAAVYALTKYIEWLNKFSPPESKQWGTYDGQPQAARGDIAQAIFMYGFVFAGKEFHQPGSAVVGKDGKPVWRVAPTPHGRYWEEGMKVGYQDAGSWTIPWNTRGKYRAAAWLWAQFCLSKTVAVKKFLVGGTPVRKSTVSHPYVLENAYRWGGLIEFYNSPESKKWTPTGRNVPHYPALSGLWWAFIADAIKGKSTPQEAMTGLARAQDEAMAKLKLEKYAPRLNPLKSRDYWLHRSGAPKPERKPQQPKTIPYDELVRQWK
jgi:glycerol transport system substrate-binding protein